MSKTLLLKTDNFLLPVINIIYKNKEHDNNINLEEYNTLKRYKNKIDELNKNKDKYGDALNMIDELKTYSFLNKCFVIEKI